MRALDGHWASTSVTLDDLNVSRIYSPIDKLQLMTVCPLLLFIIQMLRDDVTHGPCVTSTKGQDLRYSIFVDSPPGQCCQQLTCVTFLPCDAIRCTVFLIVILSVCPSVCHTRGLCPHGSTYDHDFFTIW